MKNNDSLKNAILESKTIKKLFKKTKNKAKKRNTFLNKDKIDKKDYKNIDNNIKNEPKIIKKQRHPSVDFLRLLCMYGTIVHHELNVGKGFNKYSRYRRYLNIFNAIFFWHINGFALISGIVGYKSNKYSNLLYLWLCVYFYSVGFHIYFSKYRRNSIISGSISVEYFPVIFQRYWYFTQYFGMYLFLPIVNKGISLLSKSELKLVVISTLGIFVFWKDYKNPKSDIFHLAGGCSVLWFLTFYITGAYIGKYRVEYIGIKNFIYSIICLLIFLSTTYLFFKAINNELGFIKGYYKRKIIMFLNRFIKENYNSFIKITQSISIALFILQIKFNKYLAKIICFFGRVAFGIYMVHVNLLVAKNSMEKIFKYDSTNLTLNETLILFLTKALKIFIICVFIDYLRFLLFTFLRIRKICIFLEKMVFKLFG